MQNMLIWCNKPWTFSMENFLVRGGKAISYEGDPPGDRNVIIRFPSYDHAMNWYHSEEYLEAKKKRQAASNSVQTIVEGV